MPDEVDVSGLDTQDLGEILTALKGSTVKVKNAAAGRKEVLELLDKKNLVLTTDEEGNFELTEKKAKTKPVAKKTAAKAPEPEPEETETEEEPEEEAEEEVEAEEEAAEEEVEEEAPPPPKKKAAVKAPAAKAPVKKAIVKRPAASEEDEEVEADKPKRPPPPRESRFKAEQKIKILKAEAPFKDESFRAKKFAALLESKTVGAFVKACGEQDLPTPSGFLGMCVRDGYITIT